MPTYLPGDFILWNSLENPCDHLDEKLATPWKGPFEVVNNTYEWRKGIKKMTEFQTYVAETRDTTEYYSKSKYAL